MRPRFFKLLIVLAFAIAFVDIFSALRHLGQPFPGFLPGAQLVFANYQKGFEVYDQIRTANGRAVSTHADLQRIVASLPPGTPVTYGYDHEGKRETFVARTRVFGPLDLLPELLPSLLVGLIYLAVGTAAFWLKPDSVAARAHLLLLLALGLGSTTWVEWYSDLWPLVLPQPIGETLIFVQSFALVALALVFPYRRRVPRWLLPVQGGLTAVLAGFAVYSWADNLVHGRSFEAGLQEAFGPLMSAALLASYVAGYGLLLHAVFRAPSLQARRQARVATVGGVLSILPMLVMTVFPYLFGYRMPYSPLLFALAIGGPVIFPLAIAYAIVRHRMFDIDLVIKRTVVYAVVVSALLLAYVVAAAAVTGGIHLLAGPAVASPAGNVFATAAVAMGFAPLRDRVRDWVDARFFRSGYQFDVVVSDVGERLRAPQEARALLGPFVTAIGKALQPEYLAALFRPEGAGEFVLVEAVGRAVPDGLVIRVDHPGLEPVLGARLAMAPGPADFGPLHAALAVPLYVGGRAAGCLLAGPRKSDLVYDDADRLLLTTLAQQFEKKLEQDELARTDAEAARARSALSRYVSREVAETVLREHADEGKRQDVTLMFADIRGFTRISEELAPEEVVGLLNAYFSRMVRAVHAHDGMLDKYIGDGMMVVFGAPLARPDHAWRAVQAALRMRDELAALNADRLAAGQPGLEIGIGLHSGECVMGNIGAPQRLDFTAIGDTVNTASRIESLTKEHGADILLSAATFERVRDRVLARPIPGVAIRGKDAPLDLYAVEGPTV